MKCILVADQFALFYIQAVQPELSWRPYNESPLYGFQVAQGSSKWFKSDQLLTMFMCRSVRLCARPYTDS